MLPEEESDWTLMGHGCPSMSAISSNSANIVISSDFTSTKNTLPLALFVSFHSATY